MNHNAASCGELDPQRLERIDQKSDSLKWGYGLYSFYSFDTKEVGNSEENQAEIAR